MNAFHLHSKRETPPPPPFLKHLIPATAQASQVLARQLINLLGKLQKLLVLDMELSTIKDAFDRVAKKQKLSCSRTQEVIEQMRQEIESAVDKIQSTINTDSQSDLKSVLTELKSSMSSISPIGKLEGTQKELNVALSRYVKLLEKSFNPDISKASRNGDFDTHILNKIMASHFYRQGLFDIGDYFISEAGEPESAAAMKAPFLEMYHILDAMKSKDLEPSLSWASSNADKLDKCGSDLLLKLHGVQYLNFLQNGGIEEALEYARAHLASFSSTHMADIQKLMACLLWAGKLESSPYHELVSPTIWDTLAEELKRQFCHLLGQSYNCPLSVTVAAGVQGLLPLLKFMNVMVDKKQEWLSMNQLPVPVELDKEFQFHSIFVCPVSKEQATDDNPPMLLPCGHALCKQSIMKMSKNSTKIFKCPYCPLDIDAVHCRQLFL